MNANELSVFFLDPDYINFVPGITFLKFSTVYDDELGIINSIMAILFLPFALAIIMGFTQGVWTEIQYIANSSHTDALITECNYVPPPGNNQEGEMSLIYIYYLRETSYDKMTYHGKSTILTGFESSSGCANHPINSQITIFYRNDNHSESRTKAGDVVYLLINATFSIIGYIMFILSLRGFWGLIRYLKVRFTISKFRNDSQLLDGELTEIKSQIYRLKYNKNSYLVLKYKFMSPSGKIVYGQQQSIREDLRDKRLPEIGTRLRVIYVNDRLNLVL